MPKVSVIIPVFSGEELLKRCVDSIRNQSFSDCEIILVDDGSNDACGSICDEYALTDNRIKVIHQKNAGVSKARNTGLQFASGQYITFCDGDDYYCEELLSRAYEAIENSDSDIVSFQMKRLSGAQQDLIYSRSEMESYELNDENRFDFIYKVIRCETGGWQACRSIFRNQIIQEQNVAFCETCHNYAEDLGFTVEYLLYTKKISFIDDELYIYDDTRESSMMNTTKDFCRVDDVNELSFYLYTKVTGIYPGADYFVLHHFLIRSHMIGAYLADNIDDFKKWADAIKTVKKKDFFISQNTQYFHWEKSRESELSPSEMIKQLKNTELAVDQYLADENYRALKRRLSRAKVMKKLIGVLYGS